jgi:hypothetical protein
VSEVSKLVLGHERGSRRISTVRSLYLATTDEDISNRKDLIRTTWVCKVL